MGYEEDISKLNDFQRQAVFDDSEACVVNAHVGSGKTTVLISKILYLHYAKDIPYKDMVVLTFTNKAANEIKERLLKLDSDIETRDLIGFGTFHSVALNLLKFVLPVENMGYTKEFVVIEPDEELDIALQVIQENNLLIKYKNRLKKRLEQAMPIDLEKEKVSPYNDQLFELVKFLKAEKIKQNKMTFFDLIDVANKLLEPHLFSPEWIIIDEVQDCDTLQLEFIDRIKSKSTKLFAVGDPNQIIYSWRGSNSDVFLTLKKKYRAKELSLPINYRSSTSILDAAKCFLGNGSDLTGIRDRGSKIIIKNHYNPFNEAQYLVTKIQELHESGIPYKQIAIFYRLQNQSQVFEDVFTKGNIPYEVSLKKTIRDISVLNWIIKLLRFSLNNSDLTSGLAVLTDKNYGESLSNVEARKRIKEKDAEGCDLLKKMLRFKELCTEVSAPDEIYNYFEFDHYIRPTAASYKVDKESIDTLLQIIIEYISEKHVDFIAGLTDFINSSALYGVNILNKDIKGNTDSVRLMTLHASKGLEFEYVYIVGVNYGLIPLQTKCPEEEQEEKRLFFVGITRAKDNLELSYYTNPENFRALSGESRYINMIPQQLVKKEKGEVAATNLQKMRKNIEATKVGKKDAGNTKIRVKHEKYGIGEVIREDDNVIEVKFEHYDTKEFDKAFCKLEYLT